MEITFDKDNALGVILKKWWINLQDQKGDRAAFRRACLLFKPFFKSENYWENRLAFILGLLSHVREESDEKLTEGMAKGKDKPIFSELRFRRLIRQDRENLYTPMIRVLRILNNKANLYDVANSVYHWSPDVKKRWAFNYFSTVPDKNK